MPAQFKGFKAIRFWSSLVLGFLVMAYLFLGMPFVNLTGGPLVAMLLTFLAFGTGTHELIRAFRWRHHTQSFAYAMAASCPTLIFTICALEPPGARDPLVEVLIIAFIYMVAMIGNFTGIFRACIYKKRSDASCASTLASA